MRHLTRLRPYTDEVEAAAELRRLIVDERLQLAFGAVRFGMVEHLVASCPPIEQCLMPGDVRLERAQRVCARRIGFAGENERQNGVAARLVEHDDRERLLERGTQHGAQIGASRGELFGALQRVLHDERPRPRVGAVRLECRAERVRPSRKCNSAKWR
jgi:hypothetical protein